MYCREDKITKKNPASLQDLRDHRILFRFGQDRRSCDSVLSHKISDASFQLTGLSKVQGCLPLQPPAYPILEGEGFYERIFDFLFAQVPDDHHADNRPDRKCEEQEN